VFAEGLGGCRRERDVGPNWNSPGSGREDGKWLDLCRLMPGHLGPAGVESREARAYERCCHHRTEEGITERKTIF
jgi:hypothetical protein